MDRDAARLPACLTPEDDDRLERLARGIQRRGLAAPAVLTLECLRPAAFLGGQAMRMLAPFVELVASGDDWNKISQIMEMRGSVERLIAHLEAAPVAVASREESSRRQGLPYVVVDCGSTTTKAVLMAPRDGRYRLLGRSEAPTTVEAPTEDVMVGVRSALELLQSQTGHQILTAEGTLETSSDAHSGVGAFLATSSAGGGLQMLVMGLVRNMTAASAERAALGAGAIVADVVAWNDDETETARMERLRRLRPDMVVLAGGTDDGAEAQVVALAELIAASELRPRWDSGRLPVIYAGNPAAAEAVREALGDGAELVVTPNLRPTLDREELGAVRQALQEVFLAHVMARAPGYPALQKRCSSPVLPTPAGFGEALDLLAAGRGDAVAVDLGGATCDVFSVRDGQVFRSVSANLGLSFSLGAVCQRAGLDNVARWLPVAMDDDDLRDRVRNKQVRPATLPQTTADLLLEQAAAREAVRLALTDHTEALQPLRSGRANATGLEALVHVDVAQEGIRWPTVRLLLGSGGPLAHAPSRRQAAAILIDACRPAGITELAVDSVFVMPHLGVLRRYDEDAAAAVLAADAVVLLGAVVGLADPRTPETGVPLAKIQLYHPDRDVLDCETTLHGGDLVRWPLAEGERRRLEVMPLDEWDLGAGPGRVVSGVVRGGPAGVILDGRGARLPWASSSPDRRRQAETWLDALGAMPEGRLP